MNISKFTPIGIRFMQRIFECKQRAKVVLPFCGFSEKKNILLFQMYTGLAFLWPVKKDNKFEEKTEYPMQQTVLQNADNLYENGHYQQCYEILTSYKVHDDVEIQWRVSRVLYGMSKEPDIDNSQKKYLITKAYQIISEEEQNHPDNFHVQKWYAVLLDAKSAIDGIKERIKQLENVRKHIDLAASLNPGDATTLHMLGEWCYQLADMPWHQRKIATVLFATPPYSTYEDALEYFLRAESVEPRFYSLNLLRIGNCYLKLKKEDQAKYYLKLAASYPAKSNDDHQANKEAAALLKKINHDNVSPSAVSRKSKRSFGDDEAT